MRQPKLIPFGKWLRFNMKKYNIKREVFCKDLGLTDRTFRRYSNGHTDLRWDFMEKSCAYLAKHDKFKDKQTFILEMVNFLNNTEIHLSITELKVMEVYNDFRYVKNKLHSIRRSLFDIEKGISNGFNVKASLEVCKKYTDFINSVMNESIIKLEYKREKVNEQRIKM